MKKLIMTLMLFITALTAGAQSATSSIKQQMERLHQTAGVNFVYDASLNVGQPYHGPELKGLTLSKALKTLFEGSGISYQKNNKYVMLFKEPAKQTVKRFTLSGHVRDSIGETLINATVYDLTTHQGTTTNEYGYYSLTLPEGEHLLRISYIGYTEQTVKTVLYKSHTIDFTLHENMRLGEVVVTGDLNSQVLGTQMGKRSLSQADIKTEFSLFSSPDVVKTIQRISGVQEGVELASGLYVHGGNNDENLFLLDGSPLYQINHSMGLFSSFNADMVKNVDFYKSGFPARFGGRLSSVVDVRTNDGNMQEWHGSYRIGLLDGGVQFDGPLKRNKTSLNIGLRRSWFDLLSEPAFFLQRRISKEEKIGVNYNFHDLNAKLTHIVNERSRLSLSLYSGRDALSTDYKADWEMHDGGTDFEQTKNRLRWGNLNAALNWNYQPSHQIMTNLTAVYTHNRANILRRDDYRYASSSTDPIEKTHHETETRSTIDDIGYRAEVDFRPSPRHHIRLGNNYTLHLFRPQTKSLVNYNAGVEENDTISKHSSNHHTSHELNLYAEDQVTLNQRWSLNGGMNLSAFITPGKIFLNIDPRVAVKYQITPSLSAKASYTMMTQYVHKITNSFLEMPTDYWVPTTARLHPMRSNQWAIGLYAQMGKRWTASVEGYYKTTNHLLQYSSWTGLQPPAVSWETEVIDGQGRFYGFEADINYRTPKVQLSAAYTLSWNKRKFDNFYPDWYYDKFDNRHKLNLTGRFKLSKKTEMYAAWTLHSGNKITVPTQYAELAPLPVIKTPGTQTMFSGDGDCPAQGFIYEHPNNASLPLYHRLDMGFNFYHTTKHGHQRIWNLSLYNAYSHFNTMWTESEVKNDGSLRIKSKGYIPIVPSFSYTIKF